MLIVSLVVNPCITGLFDHPPLHRTTPPFSEMSAESHLFVVGTPIWLEPPFGWNPHLVGTPIWLEPPFGWNPHLVGTPIWLEPPFGWNPHLVGTPIWLEPPFGWNPLNDLLINTHLVPPPPPWGEALGEVRPVPEVRLLEPQGNEATPVSYAQFFSDPGQKGTLFGAWTILSGAATQKKGKRVPLNN